jgi:hypothetical protein
MTMTKFQLMLLLTTPGTAYVDLPGDRRGILQSVLRESGSGRSFVLTVQICPGVTEQVHVRTID